MKLNYNKLLSNFAFNCILRHYTKRGVIESRWRVAPIDEVAW